MALLIARVEIPGHYGLNKEAIQTTDHAVAVAVAVITVIFAASTSRRVSSSFLVFMFGPPVKGPRDPAMPFTPLAYKMGPYFATSRRM